MRVDLKAWLLAGAAVASLPPSAFAAGTKASDAAAQAQTQAAQANQAKLDALQQQLQDLNAQVQTLKQAQADADPSAALGDLKRSSSDQYVDLNNQIAAQPKVSIDNARLQVTSADGRFSVALRGLIQYDTGYFAQGRNPATVDLSSGSNFRRAQVGLQGVAFGDWSYNLTFDFGGNGVEKSGYIYNAYIEYDGLRPLGFRIGAYAPPAGIEDSTGSADLLFLERPSSVDIARNIAGAPSRDAATIFAQGESYLASVSLTGGKVGDAATFDEQEALVGRLAWLAYADSDIHWLLDVDGTDVLKLPDAVANAVNNSTNNLASFSNGPELGIDATKTVNTGNIDASGITEWGLETAANWKGLYAQAGYFGYQIKRRASSLSDPSFNGWYALATWSLTGEAHAYDPTTASFRGLKPASPLGRDGFGAWELAARYSTIDLNDNPFLAAAAGGVAGGRQDVWSVGVNWYPTNGIRFALDFDNVRVGHPNAPTTNISADALALRAQLSL